MSHLQIFTIYVLMLYFLYTLLREIKVVSRILLLYTNFNHIYYHHITY